ncbi:MAG: hypothetical protein HY892_07580 [Deltaproteobacteria bacterium]|nr:hypothetical protein [Deltaproteobacteria bacterium]
MNYQSNAGQSTRMFPGAGRSGWICFALIAFLVFFAIQPSYGAVATRAAIGLVAPAGIVFLGGTPWVTDHLQGLCRLDPGGIAGTFVLNVGTCQLGAFGQVAVNGATVYAADNDAGLISFNFNGATLDTRTVVNPLTARIADLPNGVAIGPDNNIYVSYIRNGFIEQVTPAGLLTTIGTDSAGAGGGVMALAFVGNDLYLAAGETPELIANATACVGACQGGAVATTVSLPQAVVFDGTNLFFGTVSAVYQFNPATPATPAILFANGGTAPGTTTPVLPFLNGSALGVNGTLLLLGDDPTAGAGLGQGRIWSMDTTALPGPSLTNMVLGTAAHAAGNFTAPAGLIWVPGALGGHFWVSDHLNGFCRLVKDPVTGIFSVEDITGLTSTIAYRNVVSAGQATFDPVRNLIYLTDNATNNTGIHRLVFNPATEEINLDTSGPLVNDPVTIINNQPTAAAFGPDNKVYVGFGRTGAISRIANPHGTPTMENVGTEPGAIATTQLAFVNNNLFVAGSNNLGRINNAAACTGTCNAVTLLPTTIVTPGALAYDGARFLYIGTADTVWRFNPADGVAETYSNQGTTGVLPNSPFQNISALALDPEGTLYGGDDPTLGAAAGQGRLWAIRPYLLPIKDGKIGEVGTQVTYTLNFKNTSGVADSFTLNHLGHNWTTTGTFANGTLNTGLMAVDAVTTATILVTVPAGIFPLSDTAEISATSVTTLTSKTFSLLTTTKQLFPLHLPGIFKGAVK